MPELPEVETIRRELALRLKGATIRAAWGQSSPKFLAATEASGASVLTVSRRGKYLLIGLDDERELILHLGMTGRLAIRSDDDLGDHRYLRAWWRLEGRGTFTFHDVRQFGRLAIVKAGDYSSMATLANIGPEPLEGGFDSAVLHA
ncbi:MAG: DNA-formamidopyrimidine glycosylase, partial [Acidobacteria bacterium]|nr:DNA-formamidopyrimidine glycosylase [Acidobacteriota bacterium]